MVEIFFASCHLYMYICSSLNDCMHSSMIVWSQSQLVIEFLFVFMVIPSLLIIQNACFAFARKKKKEIEERRSGKIC